MHWARECWGAQRDFLGFRKPQNSREFPVSGSGEQIQGRPWLLVSSIPRISGAPIPRFPGFNEFQTVFPTSRSLKAGRGRDFSRENTDANRHSRVSSGNLHNAAFTAQLSGRKARIGSGGMKDPPDPPPLSPGVQRLPEKSGRESFFPG